MDKSKIEREAVFSVSSYINRCPGLVPYINYNDKTPMWDGNIFIYNDENINNDNFYGIVDVQIKGTNDNSIKARKKISYNIKKTVLNAYLKEGGVLFFYVIVDDNDNNLNKIYYKFLDTGTLKNLIEMDQENPSFKLDPIQKNNDFSDVIRHFYDTPTSGLSSMLMSFTKRAKATPQIIKFDTDYYKVLNAVIDKLKDFSKDQKAMDQKALEEVENKLQVALESFDFLDFKYDYPEYKVIRAKILNDLAGIHKNLNQYDQSLKEIEESIQIFQELEKSNPDSYKGSLAKGLSNYAEILEGAGKMEDARNAINEALILFKILNNNSQENVKKSKDILNRITNVQKK